MSSILTFSTARQYCGIRVQVSYLNVDGRDVNAPNWQGALVAVPIAAQLSEY
jgi:hypothetical protein